MINLAELHNTCRPKVVGANNVTETRHTIDYYRYCMENKKTEIIVFETADNDGSLIYEDAEGVKIIMPPSFHMNAYRLYNHKGNAIGSSIAVEFSKIDEVAKCVYVKPAASSSKAVDEMHEAIGKELAAKKMQDQPLIVSGKVFYISEDGSKALVDIYSKHVIGVISVSNWSKGYIRNLGSVVEIGTWYDFEVLGRNRRKGITTTQWELSRENIENNPWLSIPSDCLEEGNTLVVKCVERPEGKMYWWGTSGRMKGIELMGDYNDQNLNIIPGMSYKCKIKHVDVAAKYYKVVPFALAEEVKPVSGMADFLAGKIAI